MKVTAAGKVLEGGTIIAPGSTADYVYTGDCLPNGSLNGVVTVWGGSSTLSTKGIDCHIEISDSFSSPCLPLCCTCYSKGPGIYSDEPFEDGACPDCDISTKVNLKCGSNTDKTDIDCYMCKLDPNGVPNWVMKDINGDEVDLSTICEINEDGTFGRVQVWYTDLNKCQENPVSL